MYDVDKERIEKKFRTIEKEHDQEWQTLNRNFENQLAHENYKYDVLEKEMLNKQAYLKK